MSLRRICFLFAAICCLLTLYISPVAPARQALALSGPITVTSQSYSVHFPTAIDFNVSASDSASTIVSASIVVSLNSRLGYETHPVTIDNPAQHVNLSFKEDTSGSNFIPPGSVVSYFWKFTDSAGNMDTEPAQQFSTTDTRFTWQHLTQDMLQVNWYNRAEDFGQALLSQASASVNRISNTLGGGLSHPINLWIYETEADFHGSLPPGSYEWVGGVAFPTLYEAEIVVTSTADTTLVRDMPHELTHLIFHELVSSEVNVPTWFDEGLAVFNQVYHEPDMTRRFRIALNTHSLLRLADISAGFPADADKAYLAYAESWNLVQYMYNTFGQPKIALLIKRLDDPQNDFEQDLVQALGVDELHLENQWRLYLQQPGVLPPPGQLTPTPQVTPQKSQAQPSTGSSTTASSNDRTWVLVVLGILLIGGSLAGLLLFFVSFTRRSQAAIPPHSASGQQSSQAIPYARPDLAAYMRTSMYAQQAQQPQQTQQIGQVQQIQPDQQIFEPGQPLSSIGWEYPGQLPRKQAPQE